MTTIANLERAPDDDDDDARRASLAMASEPSCFEKESGADWKSFISVQLSARPIARFNSWSLV